MIRLTKFGTTFTGTARDLERLRVTFNQNHYIRLPQLIEPALLNNVLNQVQKAQFEPMVHGHIGTELCLRDSPPVYLLRFLANNYQLFKIVENITECRRIGCFAGRIYRVIPGAGHYDSWHDDLGETRLVAMSINLSPKPYSGGVLQLRDVSSEQVNEVTNIGIGDAILFRLAQQLRHRITEVHGEMAKTAFAGWFQSKPDFRESLQELRKGIVSENDIKRASIRGNAPYN